MLIFLHFYINWRYAWESAITTKELNHQIQHYVQQVSNSMLSTKISRILLKNHLKISKLCFNRNLTNKYGFSTQKK